MPVDRQIFTPRGISELVEIIAGLSVSPRDADDGNEMVIEDCTVTPPGYLPAKQGAGNWCGRIPAGSNRCSVDETHLLALVHPNFDGFVSAALTAHVRIDGIRVVPDKPLVHLIDVHHRVSDGSAPLLRPRQVLPMDIEIHSHLVPSAGASGRLEFVDLQGCRVAPGLKLTLAACSRCECIVAGEILGPWDEREEFERRINGAVGSPRRIKRLVRYFKKTGWGT